MTRQFDVVANPDPIEAEHRPYLVVLQSDLVSGLSSTVVAPLVPRDRMKGLSGSIRSFRSKAVTTGSPPMNCLPSTSEFCAAE
jgi:hypothetical protein